MLRVIEFFGLFCHPRSLVEEFHEIHKAPQPHDIENNNHAKPVEGKHCNIKKKAARPPKRSVSRRKATSLARMMVRPSTPTDWKSIILHPSTAQSDSPGIRSIFHHRKGKLTKCKLSGLRVFLFIRVVVCCAALRMAVASRRRSASISADQGVKKNSVCLVWA